MAKETLKEIREKKLEAIKSLKAEIKDIDSKFTFSGLYSKVAGRNNVLTEIRDNTKLSDKEKYGKSLEALRNFVDESQKAYDEYVSNEEDETEAPEEEEAKEE